MGRPKKEKDETVEEETKSDVVDSDSEVSETEVEKVETLDLNNVEDEGVDAEDNENSVALDESELKGLREVVEVAQLVYTNSNNRTLRLKLKSAIQKLRRVL